MDVRCNGCGERLEESAIGCERCGRARDPRGALLDWEHFSAWERRRYREILEWQARSQGPGIIGSVRNALAWPKDWLTEKLVPERFVPPFERVLDLGVRVVQTLAQATAQVESVHQDMNLQLGLRDWREVRKLDLEAPARMAEGYVERNRRMAAVEGAGLGLGGFALEAADVAALMGLALRLTSQICTIHGRDPRSDQERLFVLRVVQLAASSSDAVARTALIDQLERASIATAHEWTGQSFDKRKLLRIVRGVLGFLTGKLARRKLLQLVPIVGAGVGAATNWHFLDSVARASLNVYGKRFLFDKYLLPAQQDRTASG